jgi:hypothetical protein
MIGWLIKWLVPKNYSTDYRLRGVEDRRQEEEIKLNILRKLRERMKQ